MEDIRDILRRRNAEQRDEDWQVYYGHPPVDPAWLEIALLEKRIKDNSGRC